MSPTEHVLGKSAPAAGRHGPSFARWLALLTVAVALLLPLPAAAKRQISHYEIRNSKIGGGFTLTNQFGKKTSLAAFKGKTVVLNFGYTHCPDICPTTLAELNRVLAKLGKNAQAVRVLFITVDPARDTAAHLKGYLAYFNKDIVGLTGSEENIRKVASLYSTAFRKMEGKSKAGYVVAHTGFIYLLNSHGKVKYILPHDAGHKLVLDGVRRLLKEKA